MVNLTIICLLSDFKSDYHADVTIFDWKEGERKNNIMRWVRGNKIDVINPPLIEETSIKKPLPHALA
jgi:hypothetical protein